MAEYFFEHRLRPGKYVVVPEAHDSEPLLTEPRVSLGIANASQMLPAVDFDDQPRGKTDEVDDVGTDRLLPSELTAGKSMRTQIPPQDALGTGGVAAHLPCVGSLLLVHGPSPLPLSRRGERGDSQRVLLTFSRFSIHRL